MQIELISHFFSRFTGLEIRLLLGLNFLKPLVDWIDLRDPVDYILDIEENWVNFEKSWHDYHFEIFPD